MSAVNRIKSWWISLFAVWKREFRLVFHDVGVLIFFLLLPTLYPVVYTLIYDPELSRDIPVVVVDDSRSPESRELVRMMDASEAIRIAGYALDLADARKAIAQKEAYAIVDIPEDYARRIGRGEQAYVDFYAETSRLIRIRGFASALTDISLELGASIQHHKIADAGMESMTGGDDMLPVKSEAFFVGNPTQGFASFVLPGILVLILQQSLILGIAMIGGGVLERARGNGGIDPLSVKAPASATIWGKTMCYLVIYLPMSIFGLHYVPRFFSLPQLAAPLEFLAFIFPMLLASIFLGMILQYLVREREDSLLVVVFTSPVVLFLSGLTWPRYAMNGFWVALGDCIPATWGVNGFIRMNANGATFAQQSHDFMMMWMLAAVYFVGAYLLQRFYYGRMAASPRLRR